MDHSHCYLFNLTLQGLPWYSFFLKRLPAFCNFLTTITNIVASLSQRRNQEGFRPPFLMSEIAPELLQRSQRNTGDILTALNKFRALVILLMHVEIESRTYVRDEIIKYN